MDRGAWRAVVHGVAKSQTHLPKDAEKLKSRLFSLLRSRGKLFTADDAAGGSAFLLTDLGHLSFPEWLGSGSWEPDRAALRPTPPPGGVREWGSRGSGRKVEEDVYSRTWVASDKPIL